MSIASKRAKERQNRSSDELVMVLWTKQKSSEVGIYRLRTSVNGRMPGRRTSGRARKSVISVLLAGSGRPKKVRRPGVGVNAGFELRDAILGGILGFWGQN